MNTAHSGHTTTEELIVAYLDGELVRKELESVLFERLSHSQEARFLMREHLTMRGAIRSSATHELFQLTPALDARTRTRVEAMLSSVPALQVATPSKTDKPAVPASATGRRLNVWTRRVAPALALLLAIGTTWYVTRLSVEPAREVASLNSNTTQTSPATTTQTITTPVETSQSPSQIVAAVPVRNEARIGRRESTRNTTPANAVAQPPLPNQQDVAQTITQGQQSNQSQAEPSDPKAIMISHRFAKMIRETNAVNVTPQDRL